MVDRDVGEGMLELQADLALFNLTLAQFFQLALLENLRRNNQSILTFLDAVKISHLHQICSVHLGSIVVAFHNASCSCLLFQKL